MKKILKTLLLLSSLILLVTGCKIKTEYSNNKHDSKTSIYDNLEVGFPANDLKFEKNDKNLTYINTFDIIDNKDIEYQLFNENIKKYNPYEFYNLHKYLKNAKYLIFWLTKNWNENWFDLNKIQKAINKGYIPVFLYWYFGDNLVNFPTYEEIEKYYENNIKLGKFLKKINGKKLLILEPEFNKNNILNNKELGQKFTEIMSNAIDNIKKYDTNNQILFSLCIMDTGKRNENMTDNCGYKNCALGDKSEWKKIFPIYDKLVDKLDFVSFQEIELQFHKDDNNPNKLVFRTDAETGIKYLDKRIVNFSKFLYDKYHKPVFIPYIGIASGVWHDYNHNGKIEDNEFNPDGWNNYINDFYKKIRKLRNELKKYKVFGYAPMELIDDPRHDFGGYQYGSKNEYHLGIMKTSAKDEIDKAPYGDLLPKGLNLLDYIYGPSKEKYIHNVNLNKNRCAYNKNYNEYYCNYIKNLKLNTYYDMSIEKIDKEKDSEAILIPLYSYPNWYSDDYVWQKLINLKLKYPNKRIVAIVNPNNGDFDSVNEDFVEGIKDLNHANIEVVGYVYTNYGNRDINEVKKRINNWNKFYKLYGIRGIFFDQTSVNSLNLDYYMNIVHYAQSKGFYFNILNPGEEVDQEYIDANFADVVVIYENDLDNFISNGIYTLTNLPSYITDTGLLIHTMYTDYTEEAYEIAKEHLINYFYFTNDEDPNPWDNISKYLEKELRLLHN